MIGVVLKYYSNGGDLNKAIGDSMTSLILNWA